MFVETPQTLMYATLAAFVLGWLVAKVGSLVSNRVRAQNRDPRDDRIRSLQAELRIARSEVEKLGTERGGRDKELAAQKKTVEERDQAISELEDELRKLRMDLKESVLKTRELRTELSDRATENLHSTVRLREVETELSVAQASTDLIATGVLDYSMTGDDADEDRPTRSSAKGGS